MKIQTETNKYWLLVLVLYQGLLMFPYLGSTTLNSHEALVAERTRELIDIGGWMIPHLNGEPSLFKPPFPFWINGAISTFSGNITEWSIRSLSVLCTIGTTLMLFFWCLSVLNRRLALFCGFAFATSTTSLYWGRSGEVDIQLCFWVSAIMVAYWYGINNSGKSKKIYFTLMWVSLGLGIMTKGPLPIVFIVLLMIFMKIICGVKFSQTRPIWGLIILFAIISPWVVYIYRRFPDAFNQWYEQSIGRMGGALGREKPFYYYLVNLPLALIPWVIWMPEGIYRALKKKLFDKKAWVFLLVWSVGGVLFLSLSTAKRIRYALVCVPPFMVFAGIMIERIINCPDEEFSIRAKKCSSLFLILIPAFVAGGIYSGHQYQFLAREIFVLTLIIVAFSSLTYIAFKANWRKRAYLSIALLLLSINICLFGLFAPKLQLISSAYSSSIGTYIKNNINPETDIFFYDCDNMKIVFYSQRYFDVVHSEQEFIERLNSTQKSFFIARNYEGLNTPSGFKENQFHIVDCSTNKIQGPERRYELIEFKQAN